MRGILLGNILAKYPQHLGHGCIVLIYLVIRLHDERRGCARQERAREWHDAIGLGFRPGRAPAMV